MDTYSGSFSLTPPPPPQLPANPFQGQWQDLISSLRARASGQPSLAQMAYQAAFNQHMNQLAGANQGNRYAAGQAAGQAMPQLQDQYAKAAGQESLQANQALGNALLGAEGGLYGPVGLSMTAQGLQNQYNAQNWQALSGALAGGSMMIGKGGGPAGWTNDEGEQFSPSFMAGSGGY